MSPHRHAAPRRILTLLLVPRGGVERSIAAPQLPSEPVLPWIRLTLAGGGAEILMVLCDRRGDTLIYVEAQPV